uniref:Leucine-rich repeat-containing N-terminal plant-type domain-containing protein n=1 Tax=Globisporangium ultimum (strain ATCC 200006 / CBS 805.95 / DAOM BR144) TaxID=431595 RepID=K3XB46_GLOUD
MTIDITLNICYSILLPLVIFIPYMQQYEPEQYSFDLSLIYGDVSFGNLILENQSIFALSLLECGKTSEQAKSRELLRARSLQKRSSRKLGAEATVRTYCNLQLTAYKCVQYFFVFVGAVILVVHIVAVQPRSGAASSGCKDTRYPWFTSKYSCAIYEFNCYRQESVTPEETTLDFLNEGTLTVLLLTHCPALVVPKSVQNFPNLLGMEIYNSTIVEWSKEAALSPAIHQKMVFFVLSLVNMTGLPDGIVQPLPEKLQDIEITTTNLTSLPDNLHETWYAMSVLYLEYSQFQVFPETLYKMEGLSDFSMIGNQLEHVPDLLSLKSELFFLALSHNPLKSLPRH